MKLIFIILFVLVMSSVPDSLYAQEDTTIGIDRFWFSDTPDVGNFVSLFLEGLETELAEFQLSLGGDADLFLHFNADGLGSMDIINPPQFSQSPILQPYFSESFNNFEVFANSQDMRFVDISVKAAMGLILYGRTQCDDASIYFEEVKIEVEEIGETYFPMPVSDSMSFLLGNCALINNDYQKAIEFFTPALYSCGDKTYLQCAGGMNTNPAINLAWVYEQIDDTPQALNILTELINQTAYPVLQMIVRQEQLNNADRTELLNYINAVSATAYLRLGNGNYLIGIPDISQAINVLEFLQTQTQDEQTLPLWIHLYIFRGQFYLLQYEWDSSLADYNRAIELAPDYADAYYYRGVLYYSILQTGVELRPESLADFQHYLELAPDGDHAADAARYVEQIETELEALGS